MARHSSHALTNIQTRFRHAEIWKTIILEKGKKLIGLDADEALRDIEAKGYHITGTDLSFVEKWPGNMGIG